MANDTFNINDFEKDKNYVIDASAGTGKTHSITEMVTKLLTHGVSLEEILIVTYTEKAAGELKHRIRESIEEAKSKGGLAGELDIESAAIGTIHSFCQNTLSEFCISSGKPSMLSLTSDGDVKDFVKRYIREGAIYQEICAYKKAHPTDGIENDLVETFVELLKKYNLDEEYQVNSGIVKIEDIPDADNQIEYLKGTKITSIFKDLQTDIDTIKAGTYNKKDDFIDAIEERINNNNDLDFNGSTFRINKTMSDADKDAFNRIKEIKDKIKEWKSVGKPLASKYINDLYQKYQEEKAKLGLQSFNDMLRDVRENVMSDGALLGRLRERYKYAVIDEFQDTNQIQWDVFKKVFLESNEHNIIVVGDPKQSIYAFQGADINVYKTAIEEIEAKGEKKVLGTNYRASQAIINAVNKIFIYDDYKDFGYSGDLDCGKPELIATYDGEKIDEAFWVGLSPEGEELDQYSYAHFVCQKIIDCCTEENGETKLRIYDEKRKQMRNVTFEDFTVLAKSKSEMKPIQRAFERSAIPYIRFKDDTLFAGRECAHWIALLEALDVPDFTGDNRNLFRKALFTAFFQIDMNEVCDPKYDRDSIPEVKLFENWRILLSEERYEELIDTILIDTKLAARLSNNFKSFAVMKQLGDYCVDYLSETSSLSSLIEKLRNLNALEVKDEGTDDENLVARGTDFNAVKIMTIHASKGLQFPIVISVAGFKGPNQKGKVHKKHSTGGSVLVFKREDDIKAAEIAEWKRLIYVAYTRAQYVTMIPYYKEPKANKDYLEFIRGTSKKYADEQGIVAKGGYPLITNNGKTYDDLKAEVEKILATTEAFDQSKADDQKKNIKPVIDANYWNTAWKNTYSSMSHSKKEEEEFLTDDGQPSSNGEDSVETSLKVFDQSAKPIDCAYDVNQSPRELSVNYPAGTGLGNALHEVFEKIDYNDISDEQKLDELIDERFALQGFKHHDEWNEDTKQMVRDVLAASMPAIKGSSATGGEFTLSKLTYADRSNESEFNFKKIGNEHKALHQYFNGFIDLIFRRGDVYSILDWKSDRLSDDFTSYSDEDELKNHVDELYSIQRVLYSYMLVKWLKQYYPDKSEAEVFEEHFGGVYYVFLRGCNAGTGNGIYAQTWESFEALEREYNLIVKVKLEKKSYDTAIRELGEEG